MAKPASLDQLRDIHLPEPIGLWPLAPVWYVLLFLLAFLLYFSYRIYRRRWVKREALKMLKHYEEEHQQGEKPAALIAAEVSNLLRRVALLYFPRDKVAGLKGQDWIDFLSATGKEADFQEIGPLLLKLPYQKNEAEVDLQRLFLKARNWVKQRGAHV